MSGPDFQALGLFYPHRREVKGVLQPRTWGNGPFLEVCDLLHTQKDELFRNNHMGLTIYTKGTLKLVQVGTLMLDVRAKVEKPVFRPK